MKQFALFVVFAVVGLLGAAPAGASTVVTAKTTCTGSTVIGSFAYSGFTGTNASAQTILQDGKTFVGPVEATGVDDHWTPLNIEGVRPRDGKAHEYISEVRWAEPGPERIKRSDPVVCPPLYPPPLPPPPPPPPVKPPVVHPPVHPPVLCVVKCVPPKPHFKCPLRCDIRVVKPHGVHHGMRKFGGHLRSGGKLVSTRLVVVAVGQGRSCAGSCHSHVIRFRGGVTRISMYNLHVWKHRLAWGSYRLVFTFRIRVDGHVCKYRRVVKFFNHDPRGLPG